MRKNYPGCICVGCKLPKDYQRTLHLISRRSPTVTQHEKELSRMYLCGLHPWSLGEAPQLPNMKQKLSRMYLCGLQTTRGLPVVPAPVLWEKPHSFQHAKELSRMYLSRLQITRGLPVVHAPVCHRGPEVTYHEKRLSRMYCTVQYLCGLQTTRGLPVVHAPDLPDTPQAFWSEGGAPERLLIACLSLYWPTHLFLPGHCSILNH